MRAFASIALGAVALAQAVTAQIAFGSFPPSSNTVGQTLHLTYTGDNLGSPVTLTLVSGPSTNLIAVPGNGGLQSTATGGTFDWTIGNVPPASTYALKISRGNEINFTGQFSISGGSAVATSSAAVSSAVVSGVASASGSLYTSYVYYTTTLCPETTASAAPTPYSNSTVPTYVAPAANNTGIAVPAPSVVASNDASGRLASPLALVFGAIAAMVYLN